MPGTVYIVGVGPGDPDMVTVKATKILAAVDTVFVPISKEGRQSIARTAVQDYIPPETFVEEMLFPMLKDRGALEAFYRKNFSTIAGHAREGRDVALITIGDPSLYSTAWPIMALLQEQEPDIPVEMIPGIPSFCLAASRSRFCLAEGQEVVSVVSAYDSPERLGLLMDVSETIVFLKTYKEREKLMYLLQKRDLLKSCIYVKRCGLEDEEIVFDLKEFPGDLDYLSMIILKKPKAALFDG